MIWPNVSVRVNLSFFRSTAFLEKNHTKKYFVKPIFKWKNRFHGIFAKHRQIKCLHFWHCESNQLLSKNVELIILPCGCLKNIVLLELGKNYSLTIFNFFLDFSVSVANVLFVYFLVNWEDNGTWLGHYHTLD